MNINKKLIILILMALSGYSFCSEVKVSEEKIRKELGQQLINAAKNGDLKESYELISRGADVNAQDPRGITALMHAAHKNNYHMVDLLLQSGALVNKQNVYGATALIVAAGNGNTEIVKLLLNQPSININLTVKSFPHLRDSRTALQVAKEKGHKDVVEVLEFYQNEYIPYLEGQRPEYAKLISQIISHATLIPRDVSGIITQYIPFSEFYDHKNEFRKISEG